MVCGQCSSTPDITCITVYPVLNPCACDDAAPIRVEGTTGQDGPKGATPKFSIGTVSSGDASITVVVVDDVNRTINWVLPAVPEGMAYEWTKVQTFEAKSIFELGLITTGGTTTFGGTGLTVTPNGTLSGTATVGGSSQIDGDLNVTTDVTLSGNASVGGKTTFGNVQLESQIDLRTSTFSLSNLSGYAGGLFAINACLLPKRSPNRGSGSYTKADGSGLSPVGPVDAQPICSTIVVNVPVSTCMPQTTPLVDFRVRVGYDFTTTGFGLGGNFSAVLWQGSIGGTSIDFFTQGDGVWNATAGFLELRGQATLVAGNNNFFVEVTNNDTGETWTPTSLTYWITN